MSAPQFETIEDYRSEKLRLMDDMRRIEEAIRAAKRAPMSLDRKRQLLEGLAEQKRMIECQLRGIKQTALGLRLAKDMDRPHRFIACARRLLAPEVYRAIWEDVDRFEAAERERVARNTGGVVAPRNAQFSRGESPLFREKSPAVWHSPQHTPREVQR